MAICLLRIGRASNSKRATKRAVRAPLPNQRWCRKPAFANRGHMHLHSARRPRFFHHKKAPTQVTHISVPEATGYCHLAPPSLKNKAVALQQPAPPSFDITSGA
eukprot:3672496-Alexandrium_andersonii.AAC.1